MKTSKELKIINLKKQYYKNIVLENLNLVFTSGKCYMLIGENGSGKSTLIKIILRLIYPTSGKIKNDFQIFSYIPEKINLPMNVKVIDFLSVLYNIKKGNKDLICLLDTWNLLNALNYKLYELSKGMLQKVLIIQALFKDSEVYIFDEVLNGLDVGMQKKFLEEVESLKKRQCLIIITSHYSKYYESIVDEIIKMPTGEIYNA